MERYEIKDDESFGHWFSNLQKNTIQYNQESLLLFLHYLPHPLLVTNRIAAFLKVDT